MKEFRKDDVILAIGDGGNDVSMIMQILVLGSMEKKG
jgi:hydroxymethylpyrimidine pyrophosphatase-like HAD family hydrolase